MSQDSSTGDRSGRRRERVRAAAEEPVRLWGVNGCGACHRTGNQQAPPVVSGSAAAIGGRSVA
ncbi:MAG: hypothetical protein GXY25_22095 [Pirellulaceae bacterium]|nr:hypothetical protein [Thermoguttaceae bacterium]MDI9443876.1 hypothetical protein [Planctomycetota bacterium]NLZ03216.1 hypothetical protein [Pirellulaceae bacterium]